ncbi:MAG: hypothetical protein L7H00_01295 [Vulcanisaeta sp.]|nr:hypothetical protein [Vulcanisaeta sp.]MCG2892146.1 hypothetical protein [Vulcanisaeta sp.]MCG2894765.1 hypothetical protein [Vulcanisaeta sp.]
MGSGLVSGDTVELVFPYLSGYRPFLAIYDSSGIKIINGNNAVRARVLGTDYAVVKGYIAGSRPYILDVIVGGDGIKFLPALINAVFNSLGYKVDSSVTLYMLDFKLPRNDVGLSVKFHREVRRCFYKVGHSWIGYEICFDVDGWRRVLERYGNAYVSVYPISVQVADALRIVNIVIEKLRGKIKFLEEDLKYELRSYKRSRLVRLLNELNDVLRGWESFRNRLVVRDGNGGIKGL